MKSRVRERGREQERAVRQRGREGITQNIARPKKDLLSIDVGACGRRSGGSVEV